MDYHARFGRYRIGLETGDLHGHDALLDELIKAAHEEASR
jgi:hypothetical protein